MLYPNLTYSSMTHLTPAFSCQLGHSCRYPSVTITSLSAFFTLTLPTVQLSNLPMPFPAKWVTLADLSHRDNYQCISMLYPNLTYSSMTHLTPAFSC